MIGFGYSSLVLWFPVWSFLSWISPQLVLLTEKIGWPNLIFQRHSLTQYVKGCCTTICGQKRFPLIPRFLFLRFSTKEGTPYWRNRKARLFRNYLQLGTFWHRMRTASGPFLEPREIMLVLTLTSAEGRHKKSGKIGWQHLNMKWLNNWTYCESFEMFWQIWRIFHQRRP